jgi:zinc protease
VLSTLAAAATIAAAGALKEADAETATAWQTQPVTTVEGISEYRLPNGLRVLLFPDPSNANVVVNITYLVGSRHEGRGEKGMAHLLEHMLFKGTPTHPSPWQALQDKGARFNASTSVDRTNYFETLVGTDENLEFALRLEADRMVNSFIAAEELAKEMTVVRNEFERGENSPVSLLRQGMYSRAFTWHSYRDSTIGNRSDIERVPADNLRRFYKQYYRPSNAVLMIAGKFDQSKALAMVEKHFGSLTNPSEPIANTWTEEPVQDGPRHVEVRREGSQAWIGAMYHTPAAAHPDSVAVEVLASVLGDQPSGRLYKALVEGGLAARVSVSADNMAERGTLVLLAALKQEQDPQAALAKAKEVLEGLASAPITEDEVERARTNQLTVWKRIMANSGQAATIISEPIAVGDWRLGFLNRDRLKALTASDVNRAATAYLVENNRTTGLFTPTKSPVRAQIPETPDVESLVQDYKGSEQVSMGEQFEATPENIEARTVRDRLGDNIALAMVPKKTRGEVVNVAIRVRYGDEASLKGKRVALDMLPGMLRRGTKTMTFQQINDAIDKLESRISIGGGTGVLSASITTDRTNLAEALALTTKLLREPSFPQGEFDQMVKESIAGVEAATSNPASLLSVRMARAMAPFPANSIHYVPTLEEQLAELRAARLSDVASLYESLVGPAQVEIGVSGDFDEAQLRQSLSAMFQGWSPKGPYKRVERAFLASRAESDAIRTPDKPNATIAMGVAINMADSDPDAPTIELANYILGGSSNSRLIKRLRHEGGMSYNAGSSFSARSLDRVAMLQAQAICANENAGKAMDAMREELQKWMGQPVGAQELADAKQSYRLGSLTRLSSDATIASELAEDLFLGRTFLWDAQRLQAMDAATPESMQKALQERFGSMQFAELKAGDLK